MVRKSGVEKTPLFLNFFTKIFGSLKYLLYICTHKSKGYGSVAQLNRVLDYGSSGSRFESWRSHKAAIERLPLLFLSISTIPTL